MPTISAPSAQLSDTRAKDTQSTATATATFTATQSAGTQSICAQSSPVNMPTYLPITPFPTASPPKLSLAELTDRIDTCVHTYLSPTVLDALLHSSHHLPGPTRHSPDLTAFDSATSSQTIALQNIAAAYSETCSLIWQQALTPLPVPATPPSPLTLSLQTLCALWATEKWHHPDAPFFCDALTLGSLQSKWRYPAIQASLRHTTANLRQANPYDQWLTAYPTCWAYAVGRTMHQLLQWNYRLTPTTLREFLVLAGAIA